MKLGRKYKNFARSLVAVSLENGLVSEDRVREILETLVQEKPRDLKQILRAYRWYIEREIRFSTARVEHAGELSEDSVSGLKKHLEADYGRSVSLELRQVPSLIAGIRIRIGDDVIDNSVAGRLTHLRTQV